MVKNSRTKWMNSKIEPSVDVKEVSIDFFELVNVVIILALDDVIVEILVDFLSVTEVLSWHGFERSVAVSNLVADDLVGKYSFDVDDVVDVDVVSVAATRNQIVTKTYKHN